MLEFIWIASLALAAISLAILAILILSRLYSSIRSKRRERDRKAAIAFLLGYDEVTPQDRDRFPAGVLIIASIELIQMVRGVERARYVSKARSLGVDERLRARLQSGNARARIAAAAALAAFEDPETTATLQAALHDPEPDVRLNAALALAGSDRAPDAATLVQRLRVGSEEDSLLIVSLFRSLAQDQPEQIRALIRDPAVEPAVKAAAVEAMAGSGDYSLVPIIADLAIASGSDDPALPRYLRALSKFAHPAAEPAVLDGLSRANPYVLIAAAKAAGAIHLTSSIARLEELLSEEDWWLRFRAAEALMRLGGQGRDVLVRQSTEGDALAREAALTILAEKGPQ